MANKFKQKLRRDEVVVVVNPDHPSASLTEFDAVLRRIRLIPGITGSETSLLLATPRTTRARLG